MLLVMLLNWFDAQDAKRIGATLADGFLIHATPGDRLQQFVQRAGTELQSMQLNFYKRVRFANAFKWRLLEKGVQPQVVAEVTRTLLVSSMAGSGSTPGLSSVAPATTPAVADSSPSRKSQTLLLQARHAFETGAYSDAADRYSRYLESRPRDIQALNYLGVTLRKLGRDPEAQEQFRKSIAAKPHNPDAHANLGALYVTQGKYPEAENSLRRALNQQPGHLTARTSLAATLGQLGQIAEARAELDKVLRVAPTDADALYSLGLLAVAEGRFKEADDLFNRALASAPNHAHVWAAQARARKMTSADKGWLQRVEQVANAATTLTDEATLRFAIGKYYDDVGDFAKAFNSYSRANELLKQIAAPYDGAAHAGFVDAMTRVYTSQSLKNSERHKASGPSPVTPILVVGMMRSGTTLIEQLLASHARVGGGGELAFWRNAVNKYDEQVRNDLLGDSLNRKLAADYLQTLSRQCPDVPYVVDKAPHNANYLGIVHAALPNAKIIYARRDPIDTCLSCYFQPFPIALNYTLDLEDLYHYYSEHARLMAHWQRVLPPGTVLEVPYEELVANQEEWTRKILAFVGLDWDERCLKFHTTQRAVTTASNWQVRQPLYRHAVKRWHNYAKFIDPLRKLSQTA